VITVTEVVEDPTFIPPQPFTILRSVGQFVVGGFNPNNTISIPVFGPVQQASLKQLEMLLEADRVGYVRMFWCRQPLYLTRGYAPVPGVQVGSLTGSGLVYTLSSTPPDGTAMVYVNGLFMTPGIDYTLDGNTLTFVVAPSTTPVVTWQITVNMATNNSDIIQFENYQYRLMDSYYDPGAGYHRALGVRMQAS
jgi:hypothetical protein